MGSEGKNLCRQIHQSYFYSPPYENFCQLNTQQRSPENHSLPDSRQSSVQTDHLFCSPKHKNVLRIPETRSRRKVRACSGGHKATIIGYRFTPFQINLSIHSIQSFRWRSEMTDDRICFVKMLAKRKALFKR